MTPQRVLVVGETPSLGHALLDLLESGGIHPEYAAGIQTPTPLAIPAAHVAVIVAACNSPYCLTAREWVRGGLPHVPLVVVGARDPSLVAGGNLYLVPLPLVPAAFLGLIRSLLAPVPVPAPLGSPAPPA